MGVGTHAPVALGNQLLEGGDQLAVVGEELVGAVALEPLLQQAQVLRLGHVDGDLMGPEGALDDLAVHFLGAGPALGGAQDDHGPGGAGFLAADPGVGLDALDFPDGPVQGGGHLLVHILGVIPLYEARFPAAAPEEVLHLALGDAGEDGGVVDLETVQVEDGQHCPVPHGVEELVGVPGGGQGAGFRLAVTHHAGGDQIGVVKHRAKGVGQGVAQLATLMDGARGLRGHVAGDAAGEGELFEETAHPVQVLADVGIDFAVDPFHVGLGHHGVAAVAGAGEVDHVQVIFDDGPVEVGIDEVLTGYSAPMADDFFLDMFGPQGLFQQGVVQ